MEPDALCERLRGMQMHRLVAVLMLLPLTSACASAPVTAQSDASSRAATRAPEAPRSAPAASGVFLPTVTAGSPAATVPSDTPSSLDAAFRVAAPLLIAPSGPGIQPQRPCRPRDVTTTAYTRQVQGGVAGVITLLGHSCSLHMSLGPTGVIGADGHALAARSVSLPSMNPPENIRPDLALYAGNALWGFTWSGSWCGPRAAAVVIPMADGAFNGEPARNYGDLHAPIVGPQPACQGHSDATFEPGVAGYPGDPATSQPAQPVLSPPPSWSDLRLSLNAAPTTGATTVPAIGAALVNPTGQPIALSPCPRYLVEILAADSGSGGSSDSGNFEDLPCSANTVVPAHGSLAFTVPGISFDQGLPHPYNSGSHVTVEVAIAGIPTAKAAAHIK
ncbi:MAG: hypothetical protein QOH57_2533 [Mycobacterium sp.]|nr:hypothetical protein [Mycobacterium sp.]